MRNTKPNRKCNYAWVLQGNYGTRWEDLIAEESESEIYARSRDYRKNEGGSYRVVLRRELRKDGKR